MDGIYVRTELHLLLYQTTLTSVPMEGGVGGTEGEMRGGPRCQMAARIEVNGLPREQSLAGRGAQTATRSL